MFEIKVSLLTPRAVASEIYGSPVRLSVAPSWLLGQRMRLHTNPGAVVGCSQRRPLGSQRIKRRARCSDTRPGKRTWRAVTVPMAGVRPGTVLSMAEIFTLPRYEDLEFPRKVRNRRVGRELGAAHASERGGKTIQNFGYESNTGRTIPSVKLLE